MKMLNARKGIIWLPIIIIVSILVLFLIIASIGEITIFGKTFYIVSPRLSSELGFFGLLLLWIIVQVSFIFGYFEIIKISKKYYIGIRKRIDSVVNYIKQIFS